MADHLTGRSYHLSCLWADSQSLHSRSSLLASPLSPASLSPASTYIVRGVVVRAHSHPYMAALYVDEKHFCGGSLITDRHVLTAAHCIAGLSQAQASKLLVRLGRHHVYQSQVRLQLVTLLHGTTTCSEMSSHTHIFSLFCFNHPALILCEIYANAA